MWRRKGCPRCRGDLFLDEDVGKTYIKCLQCGYERDLAGEVVLVRHSQPVDLRRNSAAPAY
jgi:hypothetical protein